MDKPSRVSCRSRLAMAKPAPQTLERTPPGAMVARRESLGASPPRWSCRAGTGRGVAGCSRRWVPRPPPGMVDQTALEASPVRGP
jgi:hypothetical protein